MNCERCRGWMSNAVTDRLSVRRRAEFNSHVGGCSACGEEFARVCALVEAIDRGVRAQAAAEPSPELFARVRRQIGEESAAANARWSWSAPAAACAAALVIATTVWMMWPKGPRPGQVVKTVPASNSQTVVSHAALNGASVGAGAAAPNHLSSAASIRRVVVRSQPRIKREPEVLVPPGEAETVMELAAALQSGKLDGTKLVAEQQKAGQLIEIKPLVIAPLESSVEEGNKSAGPGSNEIQKEFVSGTPIPSLLP